ncbi:MAG TPA: hypothetical protein VFU32_04165 [Ktedonobacterales bacterium]|nr:hypothetical protein [Ktedonobacterales bacterium]
MGSSLRDLSSRQLERLKSELAEVIIAHFCYPSFLDYRLNALRTRPVDRRKRQEVWAYVNSVNMNALGSMDAASIEFRRFVERVFLRYIEMNRGLIGAISARQVTAVRARVPQLAVQVARGLLDYLTVSEASNFGRARPIESWAMLNAQGNEPTWEQIERSTQVLQTTLVYLRTNKDTTGPTAVVTGSGPQSGSPIHISDFPTKLLTPPPGFVYPPVPRMDEMAKSNGANSSPGNGAAPAVGNGHAPAQPTAQEPPNGQRKVQGPNRSPTASRPLDRPLSLPSLNPAVLNAMSDTAPGVPPPSRILSRPIVPQSPDQPAAPPQPAASMPAQAQPSSVPSTPPPAQKPPEPVAPLVSSTDAWQELLWKGTDEQPSPPSEAQAGPISPAAPPFEAAPKTEQVFPIEELPELPESFEVASALDLPPDLEELYGDYLRDARSGHLDLTPPPAEPSHAAEPLKGPQSSPALEAEAEEEVDALFDALASHLAEAQMAEPTESSAQRQEGQAPAPAGPGEPQQRGTSSPLNTRQQASDASILFREAQPQPQPQGEGAAPASGPQTSDERPPRVRSSGPIGPAAQPAANRPPAPPDATSKPITVSSGPLGRMLSSSDLKPLTTSDALAEGDVMIFAQLQHQVGTWIKMAAVSHQIDIAGRDALELIAELRRMAALEEAELQVVESLVTLCQRVVRSKQATVDDYKQAMMLYLLHHRSRLAL